MAFVLALLTFEDTPPANPRRRATPSRSASRSAGPVAAFYGASELLTHRFLDPDRLRPAVGGLALIVVLVVNQSRKRGRCSRSASMLSSTIPVAGIVIALFAAAASVSATALTASLLAGALQARCTSGSCTCPSSPARC